MRLHGIVDFLGISMTIRSLIITPTSKENRKTSTYSPRQSAKNDVPDRLRLHAPYRPTLDVTRAETTTTATRRLDVAEPTASVIVSLSFWYYGGCSESFKVIAGNDTETQRELCLYGRLAFCQTFPPTSLLW